MKTAIIEELIGTWEVMAETEDGSNPSRRATFRQCADTLRMALTIPDEREKEMENLLRSACAIANRKGADTAWDRFEDSIRKLGLNGVTTRTYRDLGAIAKTAGPMPPYQKFCILRDQRRAGEEAPEFTELEAFEAATRHASIAPAVIANIRELEKLAIKVGADQWHQDPNEFRRILKDDGRPCATVIGGGHDRPFSQEERHAIGAYLAAANPAKILELIAAYKQKEKL